MSQLSNPKVGVKLLMFTMISVLFSFLQLETKTGKVAAAALSATDALEPPDLKVALKREREEHQHLLAESYAAVMDLTKQVNVCVSMDQAGLEGNIRAQSLNVASVDGLIEIFRSVVKVFMSHSGGVHSTSVLFHPPPLMFAPSSCLSTVTYLWTNQLQIGERNWGREKLELLERFSQERAQWEQRLREATAQQGKV